MMVAGCTSWKALSMILGLGTRVRKCVWAPMVISNSSSNISPYMWAEGSIATMFEVLSICGSAMNLAA